MQHIDRDKELKRLTDTKEYIEVVIEKSIQDKEAFQTNIKQAMVDTY